MVNKQKQKTKGRVWGKSSTVAADEATEAHMCMLRCAHVCIHHVCACFHHMSTCVFVLLS